MVARFLEQDDAGPFEAPAPDELVTVRRPADCPCRHCGADRWETLITEDERGRHWDVDRCGCRY